MDPIFNGRGDGAWSLHHSDSSYRVPPVLSSVVDAVKLSKFIELTSFLPFQGESAAIEYSFDINVVSRPLRSAIKYYKQWITKQWFFPDKAPDVLTYLFHISHFALSYAFPQVSLYDTCFNTDALCIL